VTAIVRNQLDARPANLFFQLISRRYDNNSAITLTSNNALSDEGEVFAADAFMVLYRSPTNAASLPSSNIRGERLRMEENRQAGALHS